MLSPNRVKYRKPQKGTNRGAAKGGFNLDFGTYGIIAMENGWITDRQIEAARIAMTRNIKRGGKIWIRIFPHKAITKKAAETRMGKGKGSPEGWVAVIKRGRVLYEMEGISEEKAREALRLASFKLPLKTKFIKKCYLEE